MTPSSYVSIFSDELYFVSHSDRVYLVSSYRLGEKDFDYGIVDSFDKKDFPKNFSGDLPDIYADGLFSFLVSDLVDTYNVPESIVADVVHLPYVVWFDHITANGYELPEWIKDVCFGISGEACFDSEDIKKAEGCEVENILMYEKEA